MIRFGSVLRMSVRRPRFVEVLNDESTLASGIISVVIAKATSGLNLVIFNY